MLRVGLIGCGGIGAVHANVWMILKEKATLVAIADFDTTKADEIAQKCGATVYKDAEEMMQKEQLDVVDICLPTFLHTDFVIKATKYVKNVIVEKPICLHEEEAERLLAAEKESGALIQVGQVLRFSEPYAYLKKVVDSGEYGKVITGDFFRLSPKPVWVKNYNDVNRTGGMAIDLHVHDIDFVRYLMGGDPDEVVANHVTGRDGVIEHVWATYRYGDAVLMAEGSWEYPVCMKFVQSYRVRLEKATLVLDDQDKLTVYPEEGEAFVPALKEGVEMDLGINFSDIGEFIEELGTFADAIEQGGPAAVSLSDGIAAFRQAKRELE